ncbi:unnamed protein product, partial [Urochloa humidicola]
ANHAARPFYLDLTVPLLSFLTSILILTDSISRRRPPLQEGAQAAAAERQVPIPDTASGVSTYLPREDPVAHHGESPVAVGRRESDLQWARSPPGGTADLDRPATRAAHLGLHRAEAAPSVAVPIRPPENRPREEPEPSPSSTTRTSSGQLSIPVVGRTSFFKGSSMGGRSKSFTG